MPGQLFVVATPIGNLQDMTYRAVAVLQSVSLILVEDTRHSHHLLQYYDITTSTLSLHEHNETQRVESVIRRLKEGQDVALISDAGTPLIQDPGYRLVCVARAEGIILVPIPGACAAVAALSVAALPSDRFAFEGFLPAKKQGRLERLRSLANETRTLIFYESVHRIQAMLSDVATCFDASRNITVARELTKSFETVYYGSVSDVMRVLEAHADQIKGEFVVLVAGVSKRSQIANDQEQRQVLSILMDELPLKQSVTLAMQILKLPKKPLYDLALQIKARAE